MYSISAYSPQTLVSIVLDRAYDDSRHELRELLTDGAPWYVVRYCGQRMVQAKRAIRAHEAYHNMIPREFYHPTRTKRVSLVK